MLNHVVQYKAQIGGMQGEAERALRCRPPSPLSTKRQHLSGQLLRRTRIPTDGQGQKDIKDDKDFKTGGMQSSPGEGEAL